MGLAAPCPRCEKLTLAHEAIIDEDLAVSIFWFCNACGQHWEKDIEYESHAIKDREEGQEPSP